ncbi:MAG: HD domain-containing protein [Clostridiales bacterium]|nr:HD domain-containing protein [Candidatus Crickella merdequi]
MKERIAFRKKVEEHLETLDQEALAYNRNEYWMIFSVYEYLEYFSFEHRYWNTCIALPLARGLHDGTYRKSTIIKNGDTYKKPYVIHCLHICRMLANLHMALSDEDKDILLSAALCHDMIEDLDFDNGGRELIDNYGLDPRIYEVVKLVTKRKDFTEEEEIAHFRMIQENPLALLVKLADRSNNVEDMYNMSSKKIHEYVGETERFILPMCEYGFEHYPELAGPIGVLKEKITCLTKAALLMTDRYEAREKELHNELNALRVENKKLFETLNELWER